MEKTAALRNAESLATLLGPGWKPEVNPIPLLGRSQYNSLAYKGGVRVQRDVVGHFVASFSSGSSARGRGVTPQACLMDLQSRLQKNLLRQERLLQQVQELSS